MVRKLKILFTRLRKDRTFQHTLFWCLSFLILTNILKVSAEIKRIDLVYSAIFHIPIFLIVYINLKILFPLFLEKGKYFLYGILVVGIIVFGSGFYLMLFDSWIDYIFPGYYFIAYYSFWDISLYFVIYIFLTSLFRLARGWFQLQEIEKEKTFAELRALKSQVNPHFLFNSLNSIYSLARKNSTEVAGKVVQLSDLMRHIIYESDIDFIPLEKEVEMVRNYIELQNLRTKENNKINLEFVGEAENRKIAPLIFLPFVENSFKHGLKGGAKKVFVNIRIEVSSKILNFEIENSKGKSANVVKSKYKGIGKGQRVFIVGSGNSIKKLDLMKLKDENVIILNNGTAIDGYDEIMSGAGIKSHLAAPIHPPQTDKEWISWFKKLEKEIPVYVNVFFGLNAYKRNAKELIFESHLFSNHDLNWYFVGRDMPESGSLVKGLDLTKPIFAGEAASIYGLILAEYMEFQEVYLLGMDHDYFLYDDESEMRFYRGSEHQENELKRTFGLRFYIDEFYRQYSIFSKYFAFNVGFKSRIYSCSGPVLKVFKRASYLDLFDS